MPAVAYPYRATEAKVKGVIDFDPSIDDLLPFIAAANELVTELCAPAGYTPTRLAIIETWLAAHFLAIRDPRYTSERMGAAGATMATQIGLNMALTPYGQNAQVLDTNGSLAWIDKHISQGKRAKVSIMYLGTPRPYAQRQWRFYAFFG